MKKNSKTKRSRTQAEREDARRNWVQRICVPWAKPVRAYVETGKLLIAAKDDLDYGNFTHMIDNELPFSTSTAERLMAIARHPVLSQSAHARDLPPYWTTLAELSRLPARKVLAFIKDGTISARMERRAAEALVLREEIRRKKKAVPAATWTMPKPEGNIHFTPHEEPSLDDGVHYMQLHDPWDDSSPTLDDTTPSGDVEPAFKAIEAQGSEIMDKPINRYEVLLAAWNAASEDERTRFLAEIKACLLS